MNISNILLLAMPFVLGLIGYFIKEKNQSQDKRLDMLEQKMETKITDDQVRTILDDKFNPIKEDLKIIVTRLEKITDYLIKGSNDRAH